MGTLAEAKPKSKPLLSQRNQNGTASVKNDTLKDREERRQRMFKGRDLPEARAVRDRNRERNVLKGVRLNKRFELQMKFRGENA